MKPDPVELCENCGILPPVERYKKRRLCRACLMADPGVVSWRRGADYYAIRNAEVGYPTRGRGPLGDLD